MLFGEVGYTYGGSEVPSFGVVSPESCNMHDFMGILVRMSHEVVFYCPWSINLFR